MKVETRDAKSSDLEKLISLTNDTIDRNYRPFMSDEGVKFILKSEFYNSYIADRLLHTRVVEVNDQLCGFLISRENQLELLMVDSDIHGYGAGSSLLKHFEDKLSADYKSIYCQIHSGNEKALGFFKSKGFRETSKQFDPMAKQDIVSLTKELDI